MKCRVWEKGVFMAWGKIYDFPPRGKIYLKPFFCLRRCYGRTLIFFLKVIGHPQGFPAKKSWDIPPKNLVFLGFFQGAAKGVRQKEFDHFFSFSGRFRSLFGHFFWRFCHFFRHFFAKLLLPDSFCGRVILGLPRKQKIAVNKFWIPESEKNGEECRQFWTWILGVNFVAGNFPKIRRTKIKNSSQIRSA